MKANDRGRRGKIIRVNMPVWYNDKYFDNSNVRKLKNFPKFKCLSIFYCRNSERSVGTRSIPKEFVAIVPSIPEYGRKKPIHTRMKEGDPRGNAWMSLKRGGGGVGAPK